MKYILLALLLLAGMAGQGQMKGDTTKDPLAALEGCVDCGKIATQFPPAPVNFQQIIFLMQQNKELSDRLDRDERRIDTLTHYLEDDNRVQSLIDKYIWEHIDSLEKRPYVFYDPKGVRPGFYLTNSAGEYQLFVGPLK